MCLGVPGLVVERLEADDGPSMAVVEFDGLRRKVCVACVPESRPGDYVLVHAGIAISRIDPDEARRVFAFLKAAGDRDGWDDGPEEAPS
jgi:hydrogenase expression/formation protein HypC